MGSETENFSKRFNKALRDIRGIRTGGEPERNPNHDEFNGWIRGELERSQGAGGSGYQNPLRDGEE